jgi:hypothetical protein
MALGGLFSVRPIATELLNIRNPSQATCKVKVIAGIVRVNLFTPSDDALGITTLASAPPSQVLANRPPQHQQPGKG